VLQAGLGEDHPLLGHQRIEPGRDLARGDPTGDGDGVSSRMLACYDARTDPDFRGKKSTSQDCAEYGAVPKARQRPRSKDYATLFHNVEAHAKDQ